MFKHIINEDLELKLLRVKDAEAEFKLIDKNRAHLREWLPWVDRTKEADHVKQFIQGTLQQFAQSEGFVAGIWYKGQIAGIVGLMEVSWAHRHTSIGYWLGREFEGKGIMTMACRAIVDYVFDDMELHKVEIHCAEKNVKSRAIPRRLGFREEGTLRDTEFLYDHYVSHIVYGVLRSEWNEMKK